HVLAADVEVAVRVARLEVEFVRCFCDLLENPVRVESDELPVDLLTGRLQRGDRLVVQELDAELRDDAPPAALELLDRRLVQDLVPRQLIDEHWLPLP